jgi:hypothetical protein
MRLAIGSPRRARRRRRRRCTARAQRIARDGLALAIDLTLAGELAERPPTLAALMHVRSQLEEVGVLGRTLMLHLLLLEGGHDHLEDGAQVEDAAGEVERSSGLA